MPLALHLSPAQPLLPSTNRKPASPDPMKRPSKHQTYADKLQDQRAGLDTGRKFATGTGDRAGSGGGYKEVDERAVRDGEFSFPLPWRPYQLNTIASVG